MQKVQAKVSGSHPNVARHLSQHPGVELVPGQVETGNVIEFSREGWHRRILQSSDLDITGLIELMDNNPIVCADSVGYPDPASTLALIAVGPLIRARLLVESPTLLYSFESVNDNELDSFLYKSGLEEESTLSLDPQDLGSVRALTALALVDTTGFSEAMSEIDDLFDEAYERSFFVGKETSSDWDTRSVVGQPFALYRLAITPGIPHSLLRIQVMSDINGKCGDLQAIHALNIMAGFEESLGIA